jgi:hypothetical protein
MLEMKEIVEKLGLTTHIENVWYSMGEKVVDFKKKGKETWDKLQKISNILENASGHQKVIWPPKVLGIFKLKYLKKIIKIMETAKVENFELVYHELEKDDDERLKYLVGFRYLDYLSHICPIINECECPFCYHKWEEREMNGLKRCPYCDKDLGDEYIENLCCL